MTTSDEYLQAVTVGEVVPHNAAVVLAPYDPEWPRKYAVLAARVRDALGDKVVSLAHVGSTSVPGLSAKSDVVRHILARGGEP